MTKRVLTLIDEANISASARDVGLERVDWRSLASVLVAREPDREPLETVIYVGMPPLMEGFEEQRESRDAFVHKLRMEGFMVVTNEGGPTDPGHYSANVDVMMALDAMELALTTDPDVVVLATGDADFAYLAHRLRRRGIRVEIASAGDSLGRHLREAGNTIVDLTPLFRAVANGVRPRERQLPGFAMGDGRDGRTAEPPRSE
jgi:uncharacterized LabA/DUF88 family protein